MELILKDDKGKYVVKRLNDEFEFVHDNEDNSNWFAQKTLASMFGVSVSTVSHRLDTYKKRIKANKNNSRNPQLFKISLNIENSNKPVKFYNFKAVTWFAHVLNTQQAFDMLEWIDSSLNTMFNVATGQLDIDTKVEKLRNRQEVEQYKSDEYFNAWKTLKAIDEEMANQAMHKHIVHRENANNCLELLRTKNDWNDRFDVVINQIDGKIDNTKQLTFDEVI